jgi:2-oxoglutarate ferredoxin oxidoreductase subunit alpha
MMEPAELPPMKAVRQVAQRPAWALTGADGRRPNVISSIYIDPPVEEAFNRKLMAKQAEIEANEVRFREFMLEDADLAIVAFGTAGRICQSAIRAARDEGIRIGLLRPVSLYPYPFERVAALADKARAILVVEMNGGQMVDDVRLAVQGRVPVHFYGRMGGVTPLPDEILDEIRKMAGRVSP